MAPEPVPQTSVKVILDGRSGGGLTNPCTASPCYAQVGNSPSLAEGLRPQHGVVGGRGMVELCYQFGSSRCGPGSRMKTGGPWCVLEGATSVAGVG